jgi:type II secretory pathway pseudopilin PulG
MFIKRASRKAAWTLIEAMIAVGVFSIASGAIATVYVFGLRSFQALSNYSILDEQNREAMDLLTREIRQANSVSSFNNGYNSSLTLVDGNLKNIVYNFNRTTQQLTRNSNGVSTVLLNNCSLINFHLGMRPPNTNYGYYPTTNVNVAKIVDLTWKTRRYLPGGVANSENIQTARIVIRKQKVSSL